MPCEGAVVQANWFERARAAWWKAAEAGDSSGGEEGDRLAAVAALAGEGVDRDLGEERDAEAFGLPDAAAVAEEVVALAVVALEPGHVLDQAEDRAR